MADLRAWAMVTSRAVRPGDTLFSAGDTIRTELHFREALEVIGPYDVVVEVKGSSVKQIYKRIRSISSLDTVASTTTYMSVYPWNKKSPQPSNVCMLIDAVAANVEDVWKRIRSIDGVQKADIVLGAFDIIVLAKSEMKRLSGFLNKVIETPGIVRSVTMIALGRSSPKQS